MKVYTPCKGRKRLQIGQLSEGVGVGVGGLYKQRMPISSRIREQCKDRDCSWICMELQENKGQDLQRQLQCTFELDLLVFDDSITEQEPVVVKYTCCALIASI